MDNLGKNKKRKRPPKPAPNVICEAREPADSGDSEGEEEEPINTVGQVPMEWYKNEPHLGYNLDGKKVSKPVVEEEGLLESMVARVDDPEFPRTIYDDKIGMKIVLSEEELKIIRNIRKGKVATLSFDPYEDYQDIFDHSEFLLHPVQNRPEPKRRFQPSKWEAKRIIRLVRAIRKGWVRPKRPERAEDHSLNYMLWDANDDVRGPQTTHIEAPKMPLPGHNESVNPPEEYLMDPEERKAWEALDPEEREISFVPAKYPALRLVPAYPRLVEERFERCLDLYMCPRTRVARIRMNPEDLLPKLPDPQDLRPFPSRISIVFEGHTKAVRCVAPDPTGQWLLTSSDDGCVKLWEVDTGRCSRTWTWEERVTMVRWCPNIKFPVFVVAMGKEMVFVNASVGDEELVTAGDALLHCSKAQDNTCGVQWHAEDGPMGAQGVRLRIEHASRIVRLDWHKKGDYVACVCEAARATAVVVHHLREHRSQAPFSRPMDGQDVQFHPTHPYLLVVLKQSVRVYDLSKRLLVRTLTPGARWTSCISIHPGGDHVLTGSHEGRVYWTDMDLSPRPYRTLRYHTMSVRGVQFSPKFPLFASCSDDGSTHIFHGKVYNDLMRNPLILPLKILVGKSGVYSCRFHPHQPWVFTGCADGKAYLWT